MQLVIKKNQCFLFKASQGGSLAAVGKAPCSALQAREELGGSGAFMICT